MAAAAERSAADVANAMGLMQPRHKGWRPEVLRCSALKRTGIAEIWARAQAFAAALAKSGELKSRRRDQARAWLWHELSDSLLDALKADPEVAAQLADLEAKVSAGKMTPTTAARAILTKFLGI